VFDFRKATSEEDVSGGELKGLQAAYTLTCCAFLTMTG
jgi:hypothetical protein